MKHRYRKALLSVFPPPQYLAMPSVGIDVSDNSLKFVELKQTKEGLRIGRYGEESIPAGIVVSGKIQKGPALVDILKKVRKEHNMHFVRATLPEERGYVFELSLPEMDEDEMASTIEFRLEENVPLAPNEAVFGYDLLSQKNVGNKKQARRAVVSVFPRAATEAYAKLFYDAGLVPLSLETEPQAIARSVIPEGDMSTYLIVDFGRERSGISIISDGVVRFATTTDVGGDPLTKAFEKHFNSLSNEDVVAIKNEKGLHVLQEVNNASFTERVDTVIDNLVKQIKQHIRYWNTHTQSKKQKSAPISKIILCGGNANLAGFPERLAQEVDVPAARGNVWVNTFDLEQHIPSGITFRESLGYAPAIGLALHGVHPVMRNRHMANLLPHEYLKKVRGERKRRIAVMSLVATLATILLGTVFLVPSLVLSRTKGKSAEEKIALTQRFIEEREASGVLTNVRTLSDKTSRLEDVVYDALFLDVMEAIEQSVPPGVSLSDFSYNRLMDAQDTIAIQGSARSREALLLFIQELEEQSMLANVELPVSNLAASENISFSLTLQLQENIDIDPGNQAVDTTVQPQ